MQGTWEEQLVERALTGDRLAFETLLSPLQRYRRALSRRYYLPGGEREDVDQEALLGFALALQEFEPARGVRFQDFAMLKMRNQVLSSVRKATRKKQQVLSEASPLEPELATKNSVSSPEEIVAVRSFLQSLFKRLAGRLSSLEMLVLLNRAEGTGVKRAAALLSLPEKAVENALFRARKKAKAASLALQ